MVAETLEPHLVESLRKSAWEVLETMVFLTPKSIEPIPEKSSTFDDEVIGLLGFTGTKSGTFAIRTSESLASLMAAKMMMMETSEISGFDEVADAFGEIVNMLSGSFKNDWVATGNQMELSVPHVIRKGSVNISSDNATGFRSGIRVQLDEHFVDIGVHFKG
ncbi:MAG: chemotaxis protein CheX [Hyphomicrobiaceae bacterium]|jgi:chemotaxis protein CheX